MTRYHVILNANAGTALGQGIQSQTLAALFEQHGLEATIDDDLDRPLAQRITDAVASAAPVIVAAGGDGTITAVANGLVGTSKILAILPLGTVNALARDLGMPMKLEEVVAALKDWEPRLIDVGQVNGRIFLHKVVVGFIPALAAGREHLRGRGNFFSTIGFMRYFLRRVARTKRFAVVVQPSEGAARVERVHAIAVASNAYDEGLGMFFSRQRLDRGTLTLYALKHLSVLDVVRLSTEMVLGRWRQDEALSIQSVNAVTIDSRKKLVKVMFDGDVEMLATPLEFRILPKTLPVLTPVQGEASPPDRKEGAVI